MGIVVFQVLRVHNLGHIDNAGDKSKAWLGVGSWGLGGKVWLSIHTGWTYNLFTKKSYANALWHLGCLHSLYDIWANDQEPPDLRVICTMGIIILFRITILNNPVQCGFNGNIKPFSTLPSACQAGNATLPP